MICNDGSVLNNGTVSSRETLPDGTIKIITKNPGKDDNKSAILRYTYFFSPSQFVIRKEVRFEDADEWIKRSEFSYRKG